jgi:hypothetical protein
MKKNRLYLVLGILLVAAVGGLLWWSPWEPRQLPEPAYDGLPLAYWIAHPPGIMLFTGERNTAVLTEAPTQLLNDSSAVPFLVRALKRDGWFGAAYYRKLVWPNLPSSMQQRLAPPVGNPWARGGAAALLGDMGTNAKPAIAALVRAFQEDEDAYVRVAAAESLRKLRLGDKTVAAALTGALADKALFVRQAATNALRQIDPAGAAKAGVKPSSP